MKKPFSISILLLLFLIACPAFALDVAVDVKGPQDLVSLKDGLAKTITARSLAKNVDAGGAALSVSLFQMGNVISLDAILSSKPPKAFHRDLKSSDELSGAIDAMIAELFTPAPPAPPVQPAPVQVSPPAAAAPAGQTRTEATFSFAGTSLTFLGDTLFVSSSDTLYRVVDGKANPWWKAPNGAGICRLYAYRDSIVAVASLTSTLFTYQIKDGKTVKKWNRCVVPSKDGLISSRVFTDENLPGGENLWAKPEAVDGSPLVFPEGTDILSTVAADVLPEGGDETVGFDKFNHVTVLRGKEPLWFSESKFSTLPFYVLTRDVNMSGRDSRKGIKKNQEIRYHFMPRILTKGREIYTIANKEGFAGLFGNVKIYEASRIAAFTPEDTGFAEKDLLEIKNNYCVDIALDKGDVLALVVKKSTSTLQRIDLQ